MVVCYCPEDLTTSSLTTAKGKQLTFWAKRINEKVKEEEGKATKNVIKISNIKVEDLRVALANYLGIELSGTLKPEIDAARPLLLDQTIINRQWKDLAELGHKWKSMLEAGRVFRLEKDPSSLYLGFTRTDALDAKLSEILAHSPAEQVPPSRISISDLPCITNSDISLWIERASQRDLSAFSALHGLNTALNSIDSGKVTLTTADVSFSALLPPPSHPIPLPPSQPSISTSSSLEICTTEVTALAYLSKEVGLQGALDQVESGHVKQIRDLYGPKDSKKRGSANKEVWNKLKGAVTKRERLYEVFQNDFGGDRDRFLDFFTVPSDSIKRKKRRSDGEVVSSYRPFRLVVEASFWCETDVQQEKSKSDYLDLATGDFSNDKWVDKWGHRNRWEIWRKLGLERYAK